MLGVAIRRRIALWICPELLATSFTDYAKRRYGDDYALDAARLRPPRRGRPPAFWSDVAVREVVIATHRQMTIDEALAAIVSQFGKERAPSRSALARYWKYLDSIRRSERSAP